MRLLDYYNALGDVTDERLQKVYNELLAEYYHIRGNMVLAESTAEVQASIKAVEAMIAAAKRGLGISNKLKGDDKKKHNQRVMINMNKLRSKLASLKKQLAVA